MEAEEPERGGGRNCAKFGHQDIGCERVEAKANDHNRHEPAEKDIETILHQLFAVIGSLAAKNPEFIQKKMTYYRGQVRHADRHQRPQEKVQQPDEQKVNDCDRPSNGKKPDDP